jgi:hypothetical protein
LTPLSELKFQYVCGDWLGACFGKEKENNYYEVFENHMASV